MKLQGMFNYGKKVHSVSEKYFSLMECCSLIEIKSRNISNLYGKHSKLCYATLIFPFDNKGMLIFIS